MVDDKLISKIKRGDRKAFDELVECYQSQVVNIAYSLLSNRDDAYDAAQETFIKVYRYIGNFRGDSAISTWIYKIVKNVCTDMLRKRRVDTLSIDDNEDDDKPQIQVADSSSSPHEMLEKTEMQKMVREAISQLDEKHREVITMYDIEGLSYEEISYVIDCPVGTVKSRLARARTNLRKIFNKNRELFL